jgi:hypothetical protein
VPSTTMVYSHPAELPPAHGRLSPNEGRRSAGSPARASRNGEGPGQVWCHARPGGGRSRREGDPLAHDLCAAVGRCSWHQQHGRVLNPLHHLLVVAGSLIVTTVPEGWPVSLSEDLAETLTRTPQDYRRRVYLLAGVYGLLNLAALVTISVTLWQYRLFLTLASRSNAQPLAFLVLCVICGYYVATTWRGALGALRLLTRADCTWLAARLSRLTPTLRDECLLLDVAYGAEYSIPIIPEPLGFIILRRTEQRADAVAALGCAALGLVGIASVLILWALFPPMW